MNDRWPPYDVGGGGGGLHHSEHRKCAGTRSDCNSSISPAADDVILTATTIITNKRRGRRRRKFLPMIKNDGDDACTARRRRRRQHYSSTTVIKKIFIKLKEIQYLLAGIFLLQAFITTKTTIRTTETQLTATTQTSQIAKGIALALATPKYETAYACEGKTLTIECEHDGIIHLIRANYGRFSITICNDHGNVDWSVNCMSPKSLRVLNSRCTHKQNCSILATTSMFGDPCPGTHKYLEAHYTCISAAQASTTTYRPSPPWLIGAGVSSGNDIGQTGGGSGSGGASMINVWGSSMTTTLPPAVRNGSKTGHEPPNGTSEHNSTNPSNERMGSILFNDLHRGVTDESSGTRGNTGEIHLAGGRPPTSTGNRDDSSAGAGSIESKKDNISTKFDNNKLSSAADDGVALSDKSVIDHAADDSSLPSSTPLGELENNVRIINHNSSSNNNDDRTADVNFFCGPITARNLFWNFTRVGEVNVQPCPGGATGIAKWRCILMLRSIAEDGIGAGGSEKQQQQQMQPAWHPLTPDLTQCRSLWLNNLEIRVNQRDSSLISIANDLSEVTNSKTLYGGDMLVTTKIIQTMSEKMFYDLETFPGQRQREAIILELLQGVIRTGSNLLDVAQQLSWLDLSFEDQMRVATSLLTGLEDNAFLLADAIVRERNVIQKVRNILVSIRVLETRNILQNEIFPDHQRHDQEQWTVSDDRIELPRGALLENSEGGLVRIVFVAFDRLESILKPSSGSSSSGSSGTSNALHEPAAAGVVMSPVSEMNGGGQNASGMLGTSTSVGGHQQQKSIAEESIRIRVLNSKVISASLGKGRHIQLSEPIRLVLRHLRTENVTNPTCVFWNYIDHAWSEDGCYLEQTNKTHTICQCNHLTNFAILTDVVDGLQLQSSLLSTIFDKNLRVLIYISIAICITFIIVAILTLKLFNGLFVKSTRTAIYKNIYVCLLIIELLFLLGIVQNETSLLCGFTTAFLHCFVLSAIAWLSFEGFQLYATLTIDDILLEVENTSKIVWYYLLSYGLAFTIVAISLAIAPATYTQGDFCILMELNGLFYTTFVVPIIIFAMGCIGYPVLTCYVMCKKAKAALKSKEHARLASVRFDLRCLFLFLTILFLDWIFAYTYLRKRKNSWIASASGIAEPIDRNSHSNIYGYLFVTFNSMLGIYIFIFHCIQNEKIRREYRKYVRQYSWLPKCLRCTKSSTLSSSSVGIGCASNSNNPAVCVSQAAIVATSANTLPAAVTAVGKEQKKLEQNKIQQVTLPLPPSQIFNATTTGKRSKAGKKTIIAPTTVVGGSYADAVTTCPRQSIKSGNSRMHSVQKHNLMLDRSLTVGTPATNLLRGVGGGGEGGGGSPTISSDGSTHLIYSGNVAMSGSAGCLGDGSDDDAGIQHSLETASSGSGSNWKRNHHHHQHLQHQSSMPGESSGIANDLQNQYDDQFLYYDSKSKRLNARMVPEIEGATGTFRQSSSPTTLNQTSKRHHQRPLSAYKKSLLKRLTRSADINDDDDDNDEEDDNDDDEDDEDERVNQIHADGGTDNHTIESPQNIKKRQRFFTRQQHYPSSSSVAMHHHHHHQLMLNHQTPADDGDGEDVNNKYLGSYRNQRPKQRPQLPTAGSSLKMPSFRANSNGSSRPSPSSLHHKTNIDPYYNHQHNISINSFNPLNLDFGSSVSGSGSGGLSPLRHYHHLHQQQQPPQRSQYFDEPVYEEICSKNMSSSLHDDDYEDDEHLLCQQHNLPSASKAESEQQQQQQQRYNRLRRLLDGNQQQQNQQQQQHQQQQQQQQQRHQQIPSQLSTIVGRNLSAILDENNTVVCYLEPLPK